MGEEMSSNLFPNLKKGKLHRALGVKQGKKLTAAQEKVKPSDSLTLKREKIFAQNAKKWRK